MILQVVGVSVESLHFYDVFLFLDGVGGGVRLREVLEEGSGEDEEMN